MNAYFFNGAELRQVTVDTTAWFGRLRPGCLVVPRKLIVYGFEDVDILFAVRSLLRGGAGEVRNLRPMRPVAFNRIDELVAHHVRGPVLICTGDDNTLASFVAVRPHPKDGLQVDKDLVDLVLARALRRAQKERK